MRVFKPRTEFKFQNPDDYDKNVGKTILNDEGFQNFNQNKNHLRAQGVVLTGAVLQGRGP